jgi:CubicO group peptidase (beta-lactamase class C family)
MLRWFSQAWEENFKRITSAPLEPGWVPGEKAGYHAATSWFILAEVLRRLDGRPIEQIAREDIFTPLGMSDSWLAMSREQYYAYDERIGLIFDTSGDEPATIELVDTEDGATRVRPGSSGRGPIRELGRFYEAMLFRGTLGDKRILSPQAVEAMTARHRTGMFDATFQCVVDWGLGFLVDSKQYDTRAFPYGFGPYASSRTYGHGGHQTSISYCDPEKRLVVAVVTNGMPGEREHNKRFRSINAAIYEDLDLA